MLVALLAVLLMSAARVCGMTNTADNPAPRYWFRTGRSVPAEAQPMDERLREISDTFGTGAYQRARDVAQARLDATDDAALRTEAAAFIVESHLAEGDFAAARAAAERHEDWDAVERVNRLKADYNRAVRRLQQMVAETDDGAEAARAQLLTGHVHQQLGLLNAAQTSYWKVCWRHPKHPEAGRAIWEIARMHYLYGEPDDARTACKMAVDLAPDGDLGVRACETIFQLTIAHEKAPYQGARESLRSIAEAHPETGPADTARLRIGKLYAAEGLSEQAKQEWAALVAERPSSEITTDARVSLASLGYSVGMEAFARGDHEKAARWLGELLPDLHLVRVHSREGRDFRPLFPQTRRYAIFCLGEAYENLQQWGQAADVFEMLAAPGNPAEEVARFKLVKCYVNMGERTRARHECDTLADRFPHGAYARSAEDLM